MARRKAEETKVEVGNISEVSGEVSIAAGDIIKNINTIHQRALTAAEEAARARKLESKLLAQGIGQLTQSLSAQASEGTESDSPYKGLLSYSLNEAEIFYGRKEARKDLLNYTKQGPLTVLHAESGAGKTSLLQAGIAAQLIANGHLAIHLRPHNADPTDYIKRMFMPELTQAPALAGVSLREFLRQVSAILGPKVNLYLLLDQFEEFFKLLKKEERQPFLESLAACLNDSSLRVRWVLALRAEALSDLAELEAFGITPFKNIYRLNRLSRAEAQEAIIEPARHYGITFEPALIEHILDTLTTNDEVMPTHLQLVCSALTDDLPEDKTLTLSYYTEQEGGTEGILRDYLKRQLEYLPREERALAWKILRVLITADRQRTVKTYDEIIHELKTSDVSKKQIDTILGRLVERRLLFSQPATTETFELAHDYLVKEIELDPQEQARKAAQELLDQETRAYHRHKTLLTAERLAVIEPYQSELRFSEDARRLFTESQTAIRNTQRRRSMTLMTFSTIAVVVAIIMTILAISANRQANISRAGELAAQSIALRDRNFPLSILLGIEAYRTVPMIQTRGTLLDNAEAHLQILQYLAKHTARVSSVAFSPDGKTIASGSNDNTIILWDVRTRQPIRQPLIAHTDWITSVAFSLDGKTLASGSKDKTIVLWDVSTHQPVGQPLTGHTQLVSSVAFSPDGKTLASGSKDKTIILWDVGTRQPIGQPLTGHTQLVSSVAFNPDGKTLASGSEDKTIILWDVGMHQSIGQPLIAHTDWVYSVAFSPDGETLASGGRDSTIILWDVSTRQPVGRTLTEHTDSVYSVAFSPDGETLVSGSDDNTIILWDVGTHQPIGQPLTGHTDSVYSVAFSPDGKSFVSGSSDHTMILWHVETHRAISPPLIGSIDWAHRTVFSPDGKTLASGSDDNTIVLRDVSTLERIASPLMGHTDRIISLVFSPDGKTLASGSDDSTIILWDTGTQQPIGQTLTGHSGPVSGVVFSPDGKTLASGSRDKTIILWDVGTHQPIGQPLKGHADWAYSVAFSPDGKTLASGSRDNTIILWDVSTHQPIGQRLIGHRDWVLSMAFSPDGKTLASGSRDNTIILWDVEKSRLLAQPLTGHTDSVLTVAISPDGKTLASGGRDSTIILWDVSTRQPIGQPLTQHADPVYSVAFSPDGETLASSSRDNTIILWDMNVQSWIEKTCQRIGRNFTQVEWEQYFAGEPYRKTCPQLPEGK